MNDPFASPAASSATTSTMTSSEPIFGAQHIALATFLGGPLAGGVFMYINGKRLGIDGFTPLAWSGLLALAMMGISLILPDSVPGIGLSALGILLTSLLCRQLQEEAISAALQAGRPQGSWLVVAGSALAILAAQIAALFSVMALLLVLGIIA